jgi:nucleoside-diphosphate-sugar epimerase
MSVLVLGAAGFIGRALVARLAARGERVIAAVRRPAPFAPGIEVCAVGDLSAATDWPSLVAGARAVVHLASRAHAPPPKDARAWIEAEAAAAAALGKAARAAGVERILVFSSVKVHGETSPPRFKASDPPAPADAYGAAKLAIERAVADSGAAFTVLRPPLVYGPGVKGNVRALMRLVAWGVPLPLAGIDNRRSVIFLDNLIDLVEAALESPRAIGQAFLMRDDREPSTPELVRLIAAGMGRRARLLPVPPGLIRALARMAGRGEDAARLLSSLTVDDTATRSLLGWAPRVALENGIAATCRAFQS